MPVSKCGMAKFDNCCRVRTDVVTLIGWKRFAQKCRSILADCNRLINSDSPHPGILKEFLIGPGGIGNLQLQCFSVVLTAPNFVECSQRWRFVHSNITSTCEWIVTKWGGDSDRLFIPEIVELSILESTQIHVEST